MVEAQTEVGSSCQSSRPAGGPEVQGRGLGLGEKLPPSAAQSSGSTGGDTVAGTWSCSVSVTLPSQGPKQRLYPAMAMAVPARRDESSALSRANEAAVGGLAEGALGPPQGSPGPDRSLSWVSTAAGWAVPAQRCAPGAPAAAALGSRCPRPHLCPCRQPSPVGSPDRVAGSKPWAQQSRDGSSSLCCGQVPGFS